MQMHLYYSICRIFDLRQMLEVWESVCLFISSTASIFTIESMSMSMCSVPCHMFADVDRLAGQPKPCGCQAQTPRLPDKLDIDKFSQ